MNGLALNRKIGSDVDMKNLALMLQTSHSIKCSRFTLKTDNPLIHDSVLSS